MGFLRKLNKVFRPLGFELTRYSITSSDLARRIKLLDNYGVQLVLDVGANSGYFATQIRELGYTKKIFSFEPLESAYQELKKNTDNDPDWEAYNFALGSSNTSSVINVSANSYSSSLLNIEERHVSSAPQSAYVRQQPIKVKRLDELEVFSKGMPSGIYLKIDTQGYEKEVLEGATRILEHIGTIQLEMSVAQLYQGAPGFYDMLDYMREKDYQLVSLEPGFCNTQTGELLQVDGIFHKS